MLFRFICTAALVLSLTGTAMAQDLSGLYGGVKFLDSYQTQWGGGSANGSGSQNTVGVGFIVGMDFYKQSETPIRTEIEFAMRTMYEGEGQLAFVNYKSHIEYNIHTLMGSAFYDFHNESIVTPYLGAGIGAGFVTGSYEINNNNRKIDDTVLAWHASAGLGVALTDSVSADLGYRYLGTSNVTSHFWGNEVETDISAHEFSIGLRFGF